MKRRFFLVFLSLFAVVPFSALADTSAFPAPVVETFDSLPASIIATKWNTDAVTWTSAVDSVDLPVVWTAYNARRDTFVAADAPALALQSPGQNTRGYLISDPIPTSLQSLSFDARQFGGRVADYVFYINGTRLYNYVSTGSTTQVDHVSINTIDPSTGLPFVAPVTLFVSNRVSQSGCNLSLDNIVLTPWNLLVTLDVPSTNSTPVYDDELPQPSFTVTATSILPSPLADGETLTGLWTVTPDFAGTLSDPALPALTLTPAPEDADKTFTLSYTATLSRPLPEEEEEEEDEEEENEEGGETSPLLAASPRTAFSTVSHTVSCTLSTILSTRADTPVFPVPIVETFDSLPESIIASKWNTNAVTWTSSVSTVDLPVVWTAYNARRDMFVAADAPSLALQSPGQNTRGYLLSAPIPTSLQGLSFDARQYGGRVADYVFYVNDTPFYNYVSSGSTTQVDCVSIDTVDPATGLPFVGPVTLFVSNRVSKSGCNLSLDNIEFTPWTLLVTLDVPSSNSTPVYVGEFHQPSFKVTATPHLPAPLAEDETLTGLWTVTPDFAGTLSDPSLPTLTLTPAPEDADKTFTLFYTDTLSRPLPGQEDEGGEEAEDTPSALSAVSPRTAFATFSHTVSCTLSTPLSPLPRFLDFEEFATPASRFNYATSAPAVHTLSGGRWLTQNVRNSETNPASGPDPCLGAWSLRLRHQSSVRPAFFASDFAFPDGIGTVSFRYANYSKAIANSSVTLAVQTRPDDAPDDAWTTLPDGILVVTNHPDISAWEFRVPADLPGPHRLRLLTVAAPRSEALVNIDNLHIRAYGSNAPSLVFRGDRTLHANTPWSASFCYTNPVPGVSYVWSWSLSDPSNPNFPPLACTTNLEDNRLVFSATPLSTLVSTNVLTVTVSTNGVIDQQLSVPLSVTANPTFSLVPLYDPCTNVVDVLTADVRLYGTGTNYAVAWSADPPFNGTNSLHRRDRYRVKNIVQDETTEHVLTAVLTDLKLKLSTTNTLLVTVLPSTGEGPEDPDDPDVPAIQPVFTSIVPSLADSTLVLTWTDLDTALLVSTSTLTNWPESGILTNSPATLPLADSPTFYRLQVPSAPLSAPASRPRQFLSRPPWDCP